MVVNAIISSNDFFFNYFTKIVVVIGDTSIDDYFLFYKDCGCEHECVDEDSGGHHCECRLGFALGQDGTSCYGKSIIRCILMILYSVLIFLFLFLDFRYYLKSILPC